MGGHCETPRGAPGCSTNGVASADDFANIAEKSQAKKTSRASGFHFLVSGINGGDIGNTAAVALGINWRSKFSLKRLVAPLATKLVLRFHNVLPSLADLIGTCSSGRADLLDRHGSRQAGERGRIGRR